MIKIKINYKLKEGKVAPNLDYGVFIHQSGNDFSLYLVDLDSLRDQAQKFKETRGIDGKIDPDDFFDAIKAQEVPDYANPSVIGFIDAKDQNTQDEPCLKALDIAYTAVHENRSGQGIGKMMYLLAMAHAAKRGFPLMPDRLHVEPEAANIWNSFSNDSSIIKSFSKTGKPSHTKTGEHSEEFASYFDVDEPKKTKMKIDDCSSANEEPYGVPLNRAYYSDKLYPQLQSYINNFKRFAEQNFTNIKIIEDGLYTAAHSIFKRRFKP